MTLATCNTKKEIEVAISDLQVSAAQMEEKSRACSSKTNADILHAVAEGYLAAIPYYEAKLATL